MKAFFVLGALLAVSAIAFQGLESQNLQSQNLENQNPSKDSEKSTAGEKAPTDKRQTCIGGLPDADPKATGKITGTVVFAGNPEPILAQLPVFKVPTTHKDCNFCPKEIPSEKLLLDPQKRIANVAISIAKVPAAPKPKPRDVELTNDKCVFVPHVLTSTKGSTLLITSKDEGVFHSAHGYLANEFNKAISNTKIQLREKLRRSGWTLIKCDGHEWMEAHLLVYENDFFALTGKDGKFTLEGLPPGDYELEIWHERLALEPVKQKVSVKAGETSDVKIELKDPTAEEN